jgi:pyridinium-3,5-bisthiocarboxylic acid mononucleotide nickel chelatase
MRIGYLECFAGISGDMLLGALVDAGVSPALLAETAASLHLGATLSFESVDRSGISARKARVLIGKHEADAHHHHHDHDHAHHHHGRNLPAIRAILNEALIPVEARTLALRAFDLLGQAEAAIHNVPLDEVHFHEVGAVDAIIDVTCAAVGLTSLQVDRWYCSPVNVGSGYVDCAHGRFPVPAPATASLLRGIPTYIEGPAMELTTPTGAAILRALDCDFTRSVAAAPVIFDQIGYGAGTRNPERFPNVLRISIGESAAHMEDEKIARETVAVLECAIDDLSPQVVAHAAQLALEHGALDVTSISVVMKKGRNGTLVTLLCRPADAPRFEELLFRETSTLGVRSRTEHRRVLDRTHSTVNTSYGKIRIKTATLDGVIIHAQPEYEDCHARAVEHRVPLKEVMNEALHAWKQQRDTAVVTNHE